MIEFENVNKWYDKYHALVDVTETVARGEVVVVCGPSGSGKSTLIRTINRLEPIQAGHIRVNGQDIHDKSIDLNAFRSGIGFVFQQFNLFPHLSALENCTLAPMHLRGLSAKRRGKKPCPCWIGSDWPIRPTRCPTHCRAGSSSALPSLVRWPWSRH